MQFLRNCILVMDFGSQYTQLLLKRIRALGVYSELCDWNVDEKKFHSLNPNGVILSGGPFSVTNQFVPCVPEFIFRLGIPVLGICYGMQIMTIQLGGKVQRFPDHGEFGRSQIEVIAESKLINGIYDEINNQNRSVLNVWMSHGDIVMVIPEGFSVVGRTKENHTIAIMTNEKRHLFGVQFHPEVTHTKKGKDILSRFVLGICACKSIWKPKNIIKNIVSNIQRIVGKDKVILAFSGGIDSFVTALLLRYAIGDKLICIFIDNGLLYFNELDRINAFCKEYSDLNIVCVSEGQKFLNALSGVINPEDKRKIIGKLFIETFEVCMRRFKNIKWLAQGTIYSDVVESGMSTFSSANVIKSHHNVGGLPNIRSFKLLEPIRNLFKDEVRDIGLSLGLSKDIIQRYPFPGPGLAIRILGEVKQEYCNILRKADQIFFEELNKSNLYNQINQAFAVFLPIHSVGVQGDQRQYKWVIALRAIETVDFMTARWAHLSYDFLDIVSSRIVNEIKEVSRVVYDISCKPPATIEWE